MANHALSRSKRRQRSVKFVVHIHCECSGTYIYSYIQILHVQSAEYERFLVYASPTVRPQVSSQKIPPRT